jgi:Cu/Zn superoxide dismutase
MGRSSRERSPFTEFDVPDRHSSRISCLSGLLGIFVVLCVGLVALLIAQSRSRQESGAPLFAMAAVVGAGTSGTMHLYQHDAGVLIDGTITGLAPHSRHGLSIQTYSGGNGVIFNPFHARHSCPEDGKRRVGDLGNVEADDHGVAHYHRLDRLISLRGTQSIAGRMLVLHASADDCLSQPSGNAGQGIANGPLVVGDPDSNEAQLLSRSIELVGGNPLWGAGHMPSGGAVGPAAAPTQQAGQQAGQQAAILGMGSLLPPQQGMGDAGWGAAQPFGGQQPGFGTPPTALASGMFRFAASNATVSASNNTICWVGRH